MLEGFSLLRECLEWTVCDLTAEECTVLLERCLQGLRHSEVRSLFQTAYTLECDYCPIPSYEKKSKDTCEYVNCYKAHGKAHLIL